MTLTIDRLACPDCGGAMEYVEKESGTGWFGCKAYPDCKATLYADKKGNPVPCPDCGSPMARRKGKGGYFLSCSTYPDCAGTLDIAEVGLNLPDCPECGSRMRLRKGKKGQFWGCSRYPDCSGTKDKE